jgi:hypothetical protein
MNYFDADAASITTIRHTIAAAMSDEYTNWGLTRQICRYKMSTLPTFQKHQFGTNFHVSVLYSR